MSAPQLPESVQPQLAARLAAVQGEISAACTEFSRDPAEITTIVVTKFHAAQTVAQLAALGVRDFGENRHQEAAEKAAALRDLSLRWHFVGQLQTKKARQALSYATVIHSLDRSRLIQTLGQALRDSQARQQVFLQINLTADPARGGAQPHDIAELSAEILEIPQLELLGVMAVAPLDEAPESAFTRLAEYSAQVQTIAPAATAISAGMSHDFRAAIALGATHLRIGSAITGNRPAAR